MEPGCPGARFDNLIHARSDQEYQDNGALSLLLVCDAKPQSI